MKQYNLSTEAKKYADLGFFVLPVGLNKEHTNMKTPKIKQWKKNATDDPIKAKAMFERNASAKGIAVYTGKSNLVVLDFDLDDQGICSLDAWLNKYPALNTNTLKARSGSGGIHLYYEDPNGVYSDLAPIHAPHADVIRGRGYIIAPPSLYYKKENGEEIKSRYEWVEGHSPDEIELAKLGVTELALIEEIDGINKNNKTTKGPFQSFDPDVNDHPYIDEEEVVRLVTQYAQYDAENLLKRDNWLTAHLSLIYSYQQGIISQKSAYMAEVILANHNPTWEKENIEAFKKDQRTKVRNPVPFLDKFDFKKTSSYWAKYLFNELPTELQLKEKVLALPDWYTYKNGSAKALATIDNLKAILDYLSINVYYDVILQRIMVDVENTDNTKLPSYIINNNGYTDSLAVYLSNFALLHNVPSLTTTKVHELLSNIALENTRNIPLERIKEAYRKHPHDTGETEHLIDCITFSNDAYRHDDKLNLYRTIIYKWLSQVCAMLSNDKGEYGADFALTLIGGQGIGKTRFGELVCRFLGDNYYQQGLNFNQYGANKRDELVIATSCAIGEIGEAKRSLSDKDYMKRFICQKDDTYRKPYAKNEITVPRRSTYYCTSNDEDLLVDNQNRRYAVIPTQNFDLEELEFKVDMEKVWADAYRRWITHGQEAFRLTVEERKLMEIDSRQYRTESQEEIAIKDSFNWSAPQSEWTLKTATEILGELGGNYSNVAIGKALTRIGYSKEDDIYNKSILNGVSYYNVPPLSST